MGGSADLAPSNNTLARRARPISRPARSAGATSTSASASTPWAPSSTAWPCTAACIPYGGTFLVFSDYMRPPIRLAALMELPVVYVFTHDSIGVGEDGPTHQPVEQLAALRAIPGPDRDPPGRRQRDGRGLAGGDRSAGRARRRWS